MIGSVILSGRRIERCPLCATAGCVGELCLTRLSEPERFMCPCCRRLYGLQEYAWMEYMRWLGWRVAP